MYITIYNKFVLFASLVRAYRWWCVVFAGLVSAYRWMVCVCRPSVGLSLAGVCLQA